MCIRDRFSAFVSSSPDDDDDDAAYDDAEGAAYDRWAFDDDGGFHAAADAAIGAARVRATRALAHAAQDAGENLANLDLPRAPGAVVAAASHALAPGPRAQRARARAERDRGALALRARAVARDAKHAQALAFAYLRERAADAGLVARAVGGGAPKLAALTKAALEKEEYERALQHLDLVSFRPPQVRHMSTAQALAEARAEHGVPPGMRGGGGRGGGREPKVKPGERFTASARVFPRAENGGGGRHNAAPPLEFEVRAGSKKAASMGVVTAMSRGLARAIETGGEETDGDADDELDAARALDDLSLIHI